MNETTHAHVGRQKSTLARVFANVPWILIVILYLVFTTVAGISMEGVAGYIFLAVGLLVLFAEFIKSGDINTPAFVVDLVVSVLSVATTAALITLLVTQSEYHMTFFHGYGAAIVLADALVGPFNAFRTAKRNLEFGGGAG